MALAAISLLPAVARAQATSAPVTEGMNFGPLTLQPRISLTNAGIDTNVYNDSVNPTRDYTLTLTPALVSRLRMRRASLSSETSFELLYFAKAKDQRSASLSQRVRFDAALVHVTPFLEAGRTESRQRINADLDARIRSQARELRAGLDLRFGSRTTLSVDAETRELAYGAPASTPLLTEEPTATVGVALDRRSQRARVAAGIGLTPLTTLTFDSEYVSDQFDVTTARNNHAFRGLAGFEFRPFALIAGTVKVGAEHRIFERVGADYTGLVASADLRYVARDRTIVAATIHRDVEYSVELDQLYYVTSSWSLSLTQSLGGRWDAVAHYERGTLTYERPTVELRKGRRDWYQMSGGGAGYRLTDASRIGIDATYADRSSVVESRRYSGLRVGGTFTYAY